MESWTFSSKTSAHPSFVSSYNLSPSSSLHLLLVITSHLTSHLLYLPLESSSPAFQTSHSVCKTRKKGFHLYNDSRLKVASLVPLYAFMFWLVCGFACEWNSWGFAYWFTTWPRYIAPLRELLMLLWDHLEEQRLPLSHQEQKAMRQKCTYRFYMQQGTVTD